jgi:hypothetical protein
MSSEPHSVELVNEDDNLVFDDTVLFEDEEQALFSNLNEMDDIDFTVEELNLQNNNLDKDIAVTTDVDKLQHLEKLKTFTVNELEVKKLLLPYASNHPMTTILPPLYHGYKHLQELNYVPITAREGPNGDGKIPNIFIKDKLNNKLLPKDKLLPNWKTACNIALVTGEIGGITVLDIDKKNSGMDTWNEFIESNLHDIDDFVSVETPNGGLHFYFQYNSKFKTVSNIIKNIGIDVRNDGGFITAPPSANRLNNINYEWTNGGPVSRDKLPIMPDWLVNWLLKDSKNSLNTNTQHIPKTHRATCKNTNPKLFMELLDLLPDSFWTYYEEWRNLGWIITRFFCNDIEKAQEVFLEYSAKAGSSFDSNACIKLVESTDLERGYGLKNLLDTCKSINQKAVETILQKYALSKPQFTYNNPCMGEFSHKYQAAKFDSFSDLIITLSQELSKVCVESNGGEFYYADNVSTYTVGKANDQTMDFYYKVPPKESEPEKKDEIFTEEEKEFIEAWKKKDRTDSEKKTITHFRQVNGSRYKEIIKSLEVNINKPKKETAPLIDKYSHITLEELLKRYSRSLVQNVRGTCCSMEKNFTPYKFNTYCGVKYKIKPLTEPIGDMTLWNSYVFEVLANSNEEMANYIHDWFELICTSKRPYNALLLIGEQGCGKSTAFNIFAKGVLGDKNCRYYENLGKCFNEFNDFASFQLNIINESDTLKENYFNDMAIFKSAVTEDMVCGNKKHNPDIKNRQNISSFAILANSLRGFYVPNGERRTAISHVSNKYVRNKEYFDKFYAEYGCESGYDTVGNWYYRRSVNRVTPIAVNKHPPMTDIKKLMEEVSRTSVQQFAHAVKTNEILVDVEWISSADLYYNYCEMCRCSGNRKVLAKNGFIVDLTYEFPKMFVSKRGKDKAGSKGYSIIRNLT